MASFYPPKKNTAYTFYVGLFSQTTGTTFQVNPTLAAGDVKIAIDDGAPVNVADIPVVDADFTKRVKVTLTAGEMNGDNISVLFSDAAGDEWNDLLINFQTTARQIDDLAFPTVSGRGLDVSAGGEAGIDWANVGSPTTAVNLSATNIDVDQIVASVSGAVGSVGAGGIAAATFAAGAIDAAAIAANAIGASELAQDAAQEIADEVLNRNLAGGGSGNSRNVRNALRILRNKTSIAGGTLTVTQEDDTASAWTATVATTAGDPISSIDPA